MSRSIVASPHYVRIADDLQAAIDRGDYAPGDRLPSLPALAKEYRVSIVTAREAIRLLASRSYVDARQGSGTFVRPRPNEPPAVLVADDEPHIRAVLRHHATAEGYRVVEAADVPSALQALEQKRFSHIFTDLRMPGGSGLEVVARARACQSEAVIVVVTGFPEDLDALPMAAEWPIVVLTKPFRGHHVQAALALRLAPR